ncbi:MarR family transcriptional regulator [soil metagenome]|jgi:DNA-binding transcriptional regulator GbsR (MarR family)
MDEAKERYVEDFGLLFERIGGSRMIGRVLGLLSISDQQEHTAEELAELLRASQSSISQATRTLEQIGLVQRLTKSGERRNYFRVKRGAWSEAVRQQITGSTMFREMAERGLGLVGSESPEARDTLEDMREFYAFWERELAAVIQQWDEQKELRDKETG